MDGQPLTVDEIKNAIQNLKQFKCTGPDGLYSSLYKETSELLLQKLVALFQSI